MLMKTYHFDIFLNDRFVFTLHYRHCEAFRLDLRDVYNEVVRKRPSLKGKEFEIAYD